uniref:Uncharacterized protein n=1 Tax=Fundulus heteroclitus TaxID=8078 RepID=A0A3Q2NZI3_FUNHE
IFGALTSYTSAVKMISAFESCSELTSAVQPALNDLSDPAVCFQQEHHVREEKLKDDEHWKESYLCSYALDRLFSFSVLTARVFAVGDPARHSGGSAQQCV